MKSAINVFERTLEEIRESGNYKGERVISTPQGSKIDTDQTRGLLNMCANNYLGLSDNPDIIKAAKDSYDKWGFGLSSVRFICGTQELHKNLEARLSAFLGMEDTILFSSCFDANGGIFEALTGEGDAIISDELNHASIIDGVRLSKASRYRYKNNDMQDLEAKLIEAKDARIKLIVTDGIFSMDGYIANLEGVCTLAERYDALVMVDDSHATGFMGKTGRGTHEHCGVMGRVDIISSTLGKALGGASGGYISASKVIIDLLRQRARPYLFSNTLAPAVAAASVKALDIVEDSTKLRDRLMENTAFFREELAKVGLDVLEGEHPIVPIMLYDGHIAGKFAARMLELGVYVVPFSYPVVPKGKARIRTQVSAAHTKEQLLYAVECFAKVKGELF